MREWICREMSTSTSDNENGVLMAETELIRCKDCKHYEWSDNRAFGFPTKHCEWTGFEDLDDTDYCSRAERKEE